MRAQRVVPDAVLDGALRKLRALLGGIPVEYKGATVPPPDERRSYS